MATKELEGRREGCRWINQPPTPDELGRWFEGNVRLHPELKHEHYLPGITLIPNKEYIEVPGHEKKVPRNVFTPYPKVETRELYFWDWCDVNGYLGEIELQSAAPSKYLPAGFFQMPVKDMGGRETPFIGVTYKVHIWKPDLRRGGKGRPVRLPPAGTKVVPLLKRSFNGTFAPDENAVLKCQTGAIGRALGYAGMLIVPGAGIASAEDMQELAASEPAPSEAPAVEVPVDALAAASGLEGLVSELRARLQSEFPPAYEEAVAWAREKGYDIEAPPAAALRGLERQLRQKIERAEKATPTNGGSS